MSTIVPWRLACTSIVIALATAQARAELAVSRLIIDLKPGASKSADIEIYNDSEVRSFVAINPREIVDAGRAGERPFLTPDPDKLGLLVSPTRMVIEPRQRRRLRIAAIGAAPVRERIYRVTVKPITGDIAGSQSGLKLLVGYDLLVLVRPSSVKSQLEVTRNENVLNITNRGNASVELAEGKQCDASGKTCQPLPSKRLYAGASWQQRLPLSTEGEYRVRSNDSWSQIEF